MSDPVAFLQQKAEEIRALASASPEIASELRRLAEFIEEQADELRHRLSPQSDD
jgi:CHASE3 domain sensor protein